MHRHLRRDSGPIILFTLAATYETISMEFKTVRSYYNNFLMIPLAILIGILLGLWTGKINWYLIIFFSIVMFSPYMAFHTYLSIDIADEQLILKTMSLFERKTIIFNIKEVELRLYYNPPRGKRNSFYSMYIIKEGKTLHEIEHKMAELSVFIDRFNRKKLTVLHSGN